ncbi:MAG TPA: acetate uptake transporter [Candidatus Binatia bacterium]|jgi:succinate-acetate transporter protein|nr:acetate uptake transporter [Candidatus Binatia bacterium]
MAEEKAAPPVADPAALGLGAFALTTFVLSAHNAGWAPDIVWIGLALFYGGLAQFMAGMWEFRNRNVFGATAFGSYGAFWLALGTFALLALFGKVPESALPNSLGWFILAFAIFNAYMLLWSTRVNVAVFLVFLTLEATEVLLAIGLLGGAPSIEKLGGYVGVLTAFVAWYASAAVVINNLSSRPVLPVGGPMWRERGAEVSARPAPTS